MPGPPAAVFGVGRTWSTRHRRLRRHQNPRDPAPWSISRCAGRRRNWPGKARFGRRQTSNSFVACRFGAGSGSPIVPRRLWVRSKQSSPPTGVRPITGACSPDRGYDGLPALPARLCRGSAIARWFAIWPRRGRWSLISHAMGSSVHAWPDDREGSVAAARNRGLRRTTDVIPPIWPWDFPILRTGYGRVWPPRSVCFKIRVTIRNRERLPPRQRVTYPVRHARRALRPVPATAATGAAARIRRVCDGAGARRPDRLDARLCGPARMAAKRSTRWTVNCIGLSGSHRRRWRGPTWRRIRTRSLLPAGRRFRFSRDGFCEGLLLSLCGRSRPVGCSAPAVKRWRGSRCATMPGSPMRRKPRSIARLRRSRPTSWRYWIGWPLGSRIRWRSPSRIGTCCGSQPKVVSVGCVPHWLIQRSSCLRCCFLAWPNPCPKARSPKILLRLRLRLRLLRLAARFALARDVGLVQPVHVLALPADLHGGRLLGRGVGHEIRPVGGQSPLLYDAATHGAGLAISHGHPQNALPAVPGWTPVPFQPCRIGHCWFYSVCRYYRTRNGGTKPERSISVMTATELSSTRWVQGPYSVDVPPLMPRSEAVVRCCTSPGK